MPIFAMRGDARTDRLTASAVPTGMVIVPLTSCLAVSSSASFSVFRAHCTCRVMVRTASCLVLASSLPFAVVLIVCFLMVMVLRT